MFNAYKITMREFCKLVHQVRNDQLTAWAHCQKASIYMRKFSLKECIFCNRELCILCFHWSSRSKLFSSWGSLSVAVLLCFHLVLSSFRSGILIHSFHQRDIRALAAVQSTHLPSVEKKKFTLSGVQVEESNLRNIYCVLHLILKKEDGFICQKHLLNETVNCRNWKWNVSRLRS